MANFIAIIDPDDDRRSRFEHAVQPLLAIVDGLTRGRCAVGRFLALWAAADGAPVSCACGANSAAIIWGDAINDPTGQRIGALSLEDRWNDPKTPGAPLDGYHAALTYRARRETLTAGADLLGLFPMYYADLDDVLLVGSSPELFRRHPRFDFQLDPTALAGLMLTMHILQGRTLCSGSRRLAAGHLLHWTPSTKAAEIGQYRVRPSRRFLDLPFSVHTAILSEALDESMKRHTRSGERYGLMLSGGRDSRLLAGFLRKHERQVSALSLGTDQDLEIRCAKAVAKVLNFEHRVQEVEHGDYSQFALRQAIWEHGGQGFNTVMGWDVPRLVRGTARYIVNGYLGDSIFGGSHIDWALEGAKHEMSFDAFFARINAYGIHSDTLRRLARKDVFKESIDEALDGLRTAYFRYSDLESERAWCFDLYHRQRFHIGGQIWRLSFGAWPVCPFVDRRLLEICGGMPASTLAERRGQDAVLCRYFPQLAQLPLDRNSYNATPLQPRLRYLILRLVRQRFGRRSPRLESRRYYRMYDINGPGWLAVRREAEQSRSLAYEWFDKKVLDTILPPPDVSIPYKDAIIDTSGLKSILGLMLWLRHTRQGNVT
jgi:asparagine synthase (glutamine-hydrolysing)